MRGRQRNGGARSTTSSWSTVRSTRWISRQPTAESLRSMTAALWPSAASTGHPCARRPKHPEIFDAQHTTIVPGFNDSHNQSPGNEHLYEVIVVNQYDVEYYSIASIIDKQRDRAATTPADTWVEGYFYDDTKSKDKRALTVHDLDYYPRTCRSW